MATEGSITTTAAAVTTISTNRTQSRSIAPIYLSYSNQTGFTERYFVVQLYQQLLTHGLGEGVIWFDHEQGIHPDKSATWFADRLEAIDLSLGSILILSDACQHQRFMTIESKAIVDRKILSETATMYGLFVIFLNNCPDYNYIRSHADFCYTFSKADASSSVEERVAIVLHPLLAKLLPYKKFQCLKIPVEQVDQDKEKENFKPICSWTTTDIQAFLTRCAIPESCRELFDHKHMDGFLLLSCTENELKQYFGMQNRKIRQTLIDHVIQIIHQERQTLNQWHYSAKKSRGKSDCAYVIYDPEDFSIASQISMFLQEKRFRVFSHNPRYGRTKKEFLALNGPTIARSKDIIYVLTEKSSRSTFTFHELSLAEWFEKPIVTLYIDNVWTHMRSSIRALLADYPSIDFINQAFSDSLTILHTYLRPQMLSTDETPDFIQRLKQIVRPLANMAASNRNSTQKMSSLSTGNNEVDPRSVYLSYSKTDEKWNAIHAIERMIFFLESHGFRTGIQINNKVQTSRESDPHFLPKIHTKSSSIHPGDSYVDGFNPSISTSSVDLRHNLITGDIRHCRIMIVCLTPKYFRNENCINELRLCEIYQKPMIVCLLRHLEPYRSHQQLLNTSMNLEEQIIMSVSSRVPMTTLNYLRKSLRHSCIDLTTNELFSRNASLLLQRLEMIAIGSSNSIGSPSSSMNRAGFTQTSEVF